MSPMSPRLLRPRQTTHLEAANWASRVVANGGSVSGSTLSAVSKFCRSIDAAAGLRAKFRRLSLMCGNNLQAALVPLYRNSSGTGAQLGGITDINLAISGQSPFVSGDYSLTGGLVGTGNAYLDTDLDPADITATTSHLAVYHRGATLTDTTTRYLIGSASGSEFYAMAARLNSGLAQNRVVIGDTTLTNISESSSEWGGGLRVVTRNGDTDMRTYRGATEINAYFVPVTPSTHLSDWWLFALNSGGTAAGVSSATLYGYSIGAALTVDDVAAYNTAMTTFQTAIGRTI